MPPAKTPNPDNVNQADSVKSTPQTYLRYLFPFSIERESQGWRVRIYWKQLVLCFITYASFGWLSAASIAYFFVKYQRGFSEVQFTHMLLLPVKWREYEIARGEFLIKNAQRELNNKNFQKAFYDLRIGLIKSPANKEARLLLVQFYGLLKRPDLTRSTLLEGFTYHKNDQAYLNTLFSYLLQQQDDRQVLVYYKELLANDNAITPRNQLVALAGASSCYFRGNYDGAETILRKYNLELTRNGRLLFARISWDRGLREQTIDQLHELAAEFPDDEEIYTQTVVYLRESGRDSEARRESFMHALGNPRNARARIDQLYALLKEGDFDAVNSNSEDIFRDFATNSNALLALGDFAANSGNTKLARRIYDHAKTHDLNWEGPAMMTVEANIVSKQYQTALDLIGKLRKDNPEWGKRYYSVLNGLEAIAHYGLGDADSAQLSLNNFVSQSDVRAENLAAVSKRLMGVGAFTQARQMLDQAVKTDPLNQAALTSLIQLDLDQNNIAPLADNIRKLLAMRRPSQDVLKSAYRKLGSDLFVFAPDRIALLKELRFAIFAPPTGS